MTALTKARNTPQRDVATIDPVTPHTPRAVLVGALAYFVMPADIVPDFLVGTGFLDDATVLGFALQSVQRHILPVHRERARLALEQPMEAGAA